MAKACSRGINAIIPGTSESDTRRKPQRYQHSLAAWTGYQLLSSLPSLLSSFHTSFCPFLKIKFFFKKKERKLGEIKGSLNSHTSISKLPFHCVLLLEKIFSVLKILSFQMWISPPNILPVGDLTNSYSTRVKNALSASFKMETLGVELLPGVSSSSSFSSPRIAVKCLCKEARWLLEPPLPFIFCSNVSVKCHCGASAQSCSSRPLRNMLLILHNALTGKAQKTKPGEGLVVTSACPC